MPPPRVLIYHRVSDDPIDAQLLCVSPSNFDRQLAHLAGHYRVVPLRRQIAEMARGVLHDGTVSITFDDGYADNLTEALPILEKHRLHATIFITSGMLGSTIGFWGDAVERILLTTPSLPERLCIEGVIDVPTRNEADILRAHDELRRVLRGRTAESIWKTVQTLQQWAGREASGPPERPVLNLNQLHRLAASPFIEIGAHTVTHTRLDVLPRAAQKEEIGGSRNALEQVLGKPVTLFAYPYGSADAYNKDSVELVQALGFEAGIANLQGDLRTGASLFEMPRRLVRDWPEDVFASWMSDPDRSDAEARSLAQRGERLLHVRRNASASKGTAQQQSDRSDVHSPAHDRSEIPSSQRLPVRRVVHVNHYLGHGGAATSTLRLCRSQRDSGIDARVLAEKVAIDVDFAQTFDPMPDPDLAKICLAEGLLDTHLQGSHRLASHPWIKATDLVHFQNLHGGYFNPLSIPLISARKPVVWTLRDMHSVTGHCAHSLDCDRWRTGCHECPDLHCYPPVQKDNCNALWELKRLAYACSRLQIVAPSRWIKDIAEQGLLSEQPIELIYNGVDLSVFRPINKRKARKRLGLPVKGLLIGTAADYGLANPYKGGQHFARVAAALRSRHAGLTFVSIGSKQCRAGFSTDGILELPYLEGEGGMAAYYSALDFFLYTAIADTCPLVLIEAVACGLPVVAFRTGGVPEIARDGKEGLIAPYRDEQALFLAAEQMIRASSATREAYSQSARAHAEHTFDIRQMRDAYLDLYCRVIERWHRTEPAPPLPVDQLPDLFRSDALLEATGHAFAVTTSSTRPASAVTPSAVPTPGDAPAPVINSADLLSRAADLAAQGEALVEQGDISAAERLFREAITLGAPLARPYNNLGAILWHLGDRESALKFFSDGLARQPDDWTTCANLADGYLATGQIEQARMTLMAFAASNPDSNEALSAILSLPVSGAMPGGIEESVTQPPMVEVATSIAPFGIPVQAAAIDTWRALGCRVVSVNSPSEIATLKPYFPEVRFVEAKRTGQKITGKPHVFIDDLLAALREGGAPINAIANSDIFLRVTPDQLARITEHASGGLVYGSRCEIPSPETSDGPLYRRGFDYFFFDRALIERLPASDYMLGVPWWDYWVPWAALRAELPVWRYDAHIAYHVSHPVNYSVELVERFGQRFLQQAATSFMRCTANAVQNQLPNTPWAYVLADQVVSELGRLSQRLDQPAISATPKVTAIVSTYASEKFIAECLDDLVGQSIADEIEVVVIDAASPESEADVVRRYQEKHPNIRYVRTPERIGVYAAWNMAIRVARGEYLISCSTNDRLRPDALEILAATLDERPEVALAYGNSYLTKTPHQSFGDFSLSDAYIWDQADLGELLKGPSIGPHPMWRRQLHDELGFFDESFAAIADQDFWLRIAKKHKLHKIDDFTGLYWVTEDSLSGNAARAQAEYREINERHRRPFAYESWNTTRYFTQAIARHYEARMEHWRQRPLFHVYVRHLGADFTALSRTIQSLSAQYYQDLRIVILSPQAAPAGIGGERMRWVICPAERWQEGVAATLPQGEADWLCFLVDGDVLDPRMFLVLGEAIHCHPAWRVIFADEDEITGEATGDFEVPHFKPGLDPDRLLASPCLGEAAIVSARWLEARGGLANDLPGAECHDLALRVIESEGAAGVGRVADVLLHRPAGRYDHRASAAHQQAVIRHLQRRGVAATVAPGMADTLRVIYDHPAPASVAVVIPFSSSVALLEAALTSVLDKTRYPAFRVVVAACCHGADAAADAFLAGLEQMGLDKIAVVRLAHGTTTAQAVETLLATVGEDYLVAWPESATAVQEDWLAAMTNLAQRDDVVAVGPRLLTQDGLVASAGLELGVCGAAGSPNLGVRMEYPGEAAHLAVTRRVAALDARCLLLKVAAVRQAGGIDTAMGEWWATDLAMRLGDCGVLLWTPYAIALVKEDLAQLEQSDKARLDRQGPPPTEAEQAFYRRWFARLGHDPYRNPNLDRNYRGHAPETMQALVFDPLPWKPVPKVFARVADETGCGHYRIMTPMRALLGAGKVRGGISLRNISIAEMSALEADVWIFQRQITEELFPVIGDCAEYAPGLRVYEIDDLITQIPPDSPHHAEFTPAMLERFRRGVGLCDRLVVATEPLARAYGKLTDETRVLPNYLPNKPWLDLAPTRRDGPRPRVGWAGSVSHEGDLKKFGEVVIALADEVDWVFFGPCPAALRPYVRETHRAVNINNYPAHLAALALDLAVAPLEINAFNEAKSHLKLLEYGVLGYPVVCSDIVPYQGAFPVTRVRNRAKDWIAAIREHLADPDASRRQGQALREHVLANWMLDDHLDDWLRAWSR